MDVLDLLDKAEQKATIGPWGTQVIDDGEPNPMAVISLSEKIDHDTDNLVCVAEYFPSDARLIALMRNNIRALIDIAKAAREIKEHEDGCSKNYAFDVDECRCGFERLKEALTKLGDGDG